MKTTRQRIERFVIIFHPTYSLCGGMAIEPPNNSMYIECMIENIPFKV